MKESDVLEQLSLLRNKEVNEIRVEKEEFLSFRSILVAQKDFKQFSGIAQHGGSICYRYLDTPRS